MTKIEQFHTAWKNYNLDEACWIASTDIVRNYELKIAFDCDTTSCSVTIENGKGGRAILAEWKLAELEYVIHQSGDKTGELDESFSVTCDPFDNMPVSIARLLQSCSNREEILEQVFKYTVVTQGAKEQMESVYF